MQDSTQEHRGWGPFLKRAIKPLLIVIVVLGIGQSVRLAWLDLRATQNKTYTQLIRLQSRMTNASAEERVLIEAEITAVERSQFSIANIRWDIACWSIVLSMAAVIPPAIYWWLTLLNFQYAVPFFSTQAIYAAGGLGKYVPGKAMVLVLRSGAMQRHGVPISTSIVSIFVETLTSLAVGGALGALTLAALNPPAWLLAMAILAASLSLLPTMPPVFRRLLAVLVRYRQLRLPNQLATAMSWRLVASGWLLIALGWLLMGSSLWLLCEAIRQSMAAEPLADTAVAVSSLRLWWISVAASCLGFVIGFLSMLPGGAGVREVVVMMLLVPAIGYAPALAAAVLYRLSTLMAELIMAIIAWCIAKVSA